MSQATVHPPPVHWQISKNYALKRLKEDFGIPEFQRKQSSPHIRSMVKSILQNKFYDNVIRFYVDKDGKKQLLDGQQRISALWIAHNEHKVERYDLLLGEYEEEFGRTVFRKLNMGKPLTTRDHSKALDDHKNSFFNELQPWLAHDRTPAKATYVEMLHALNYKNGMVRPVGIRDLDTVVEGINAKDIEVMKAFSEACRRVSPVVFRSFIYKSLVYRNVFKIGYEAGLDKEQFVELLTLCLTNKKLKEAAAMRLQQEMPVAYKIIHDTLLPRVE